MVVVLDTPHFGKRQWGLVRPLHISPLGCHKMLERQGTRQYWELKRQGIDSRTQFKKERYHES